jgi:class 3 adenylate cyclase
MGEWTRSTTPLTAQRSAIISASSANAAHGLDLRLRVGIDTGAVTAGIVGQSKFVYHMWGETVNVAQAARFTDAEGIFVSEAVFGRFRDAYRFEPAGEVHTRSGNRPVWRLLAGERVAAET